MALFGGSNPSRSALPSAIFAPHAHFGFIGYVVPLGKPAVGRESRLLEYGSDEI
jgi:hypothetical protein